MDELPWLALAEGGWSFEIKWLQRQQSWTLGIWKPDKPQWKTGLVEHATGPDDVAALRRLIDRALVEHEQLKLT